MRTVSDYLATFLAERQVTHVFGFQGSAMLKLLDDICQHGISYVQGFHEQASAFSACGYARISGNIGVAIATSGPGVINLMGGIADAWFDSVPCLFITGQDYLSNITKHNGARQNGFQDMDVISLVSSITKYAVLIDDPYSISYHLERAFWEIEHGRKGPAVIDIPIDIQFAQIDESKLSHFTPPQIQEKYSISDCRAAAELLKAAHRPLILAGGGIRLAQAVAEFHRLVEKTHLPVIATLNGLDVPADLYGFSGLHGTTHANLAAKQADVILAIGTRLSLRQVGKRPREEFSNAKIIHIDVDPCELGRVIDEEVSICAPLKIAINALSEELGDCGFLGDNFWHTSLREQKDALLSRLEVPCSGINPVYFARYVYSHATAHCISCADIGQNQMWVAQAYQSGPFRRMVNSGGYGSMGFALPAAIGASISKPETPVLCFTGDGGFHMNLQELEFLTLHRPNIKCIVFNNNVLGLMREVSSRYYQSHYYGNTPKDFCCANLGRLALAYDIPYVRIECKEDLPAMDQLLLSPGPCLIECVLSVDAQSVNRYDEMISLENSKI